MTEYIQLHIHYYGPQFIINDGANEVSHSPAPLTVSSRSTRRQNQFEMYKSFIPWVLSQYHIVVIVEYSLTVFCARE